MPLFKKPVPQDPLVVSMTGTRLGQRVLIVPSSHDDVVLAIAAKVGLTGHVALVTSDPARARTLATRALNAGLLVDTDTGGRAPDDDAPFDLAIVDARGSHAPLDATTLASLHGRLRHGGRLIVLVAAGGGLSALFGGGSAPDPARETTALLAAGFRTARVLGTRDRIAFIEALKSDVR